MTSGPIDPGPPEDAAEEAVVADARPVPSLLRNLAHMLSSQALTWLLATLVAVLQPRYLGPDELGRLRLPLAIWVIAQLAVNLGTTTHLTLEVARDRAKGLALVGPTLALRLVMFSVVLVLLGTGTFALDASTDAVLIMLIFGLNVLLTSVADVYIAALTGLEEMSFPAIASVVSKLLYTLAVIAVLVGGGGVVPVAGTMLVGAVVNLLVVRSAFRRFSVVEFHDALAPIAPIVRASWPFFVSTAVAVVYLTIDTIVISTLADDTTVGWYSTADTLFSTLLFVPSIVTTTLLPRLGRLYVHDFAEMQRLVYRAFGTLLLLGVPIGLGTVVVAGEFAPLLFGEQYRESGPVLAVFGIVLIFVFCTTLLGGVATATGRQSLWNLLMFGAIVASIPLDIALVPWTEQRYRNGAIGAALAYIVTEGAMMVVGVWRVAPGVANRESMVRIGKILAAGGLLFAATWPLRDRLFVIPAVVGTVVYAAAVLALRALTDDESRMLNRALGRLGWRRRGAATD